MALSLPSLMVSSISPVAILATVATVGRVEPLGESCAAPPAFVAYHPTRRCFAGLDNLAPEVVYSRGARTIAPGNDTPWIVTRSGFPSF